MQMPDYQFIYYIVKLGIVNVRLLYSYLLYIAPASPCEMFTKKRGANNQQSKLGPVVPQLSVIYAWYLTSHLCPFFLRHFR